MAMLTSIEKSVTSNLKNELKRIVRVNPVKEIKFLFAIVFVRK